jgi:AraC-like DNA-binding protein
MIGETCGAAGSLRRLCCRLAFIVLGLPEGTALSMGDEFRRTVVADPRNIKAAVSGILPPSVMRLANYRGTEARHYEAADRRTFETDPDSYLTSIAVTHSGLLRIASIADQRGIAYHIEEPGLPAYCLCLVQHGGVRLQSSRGDEGLEFGGATAAIFAGRPGTSFISSDNNQRLTVWIPLAKLHEDLESLIERPIMGDIAFAPAIDLTTSAGISLHGLVGYLEHELSRPDSLMSMQITASLFEDLLCGTILSGVKHSHSEWLRRPHPGGDIRTVRRAEDYMHAHLADPITVRDLARSAGCGVRSLQLAFRQARGMTPMQALQRARLHQARQALERPESDTSVLDVALRFGFNHPGRFARVYERAFGQRPSWTLRKGRG